MSGLIQVEGQSEGVFHPQLGEIKTDALARRALKEFPPVAWFTKRIEIPKCLTVHSFLITDKKTGEQREVCVDSDISNAMTLNRIALGFVIADIPVTPWPEHYGYRTDEGKELNESARGYGDDPDDWYVSEEPVDVMKVREAWLSLSILKPKLERADWYVSDIRKMVAMCRERGDVYIPPAWLKPDQAENLARRLGLPVGKF